MFMPQSLSARPSPPLGGPSPSATLSARPGVLETAAGRGYQFPAVPASPQVLPSLLFLH